MELAEQRYQSLLNLLAQKGTLRTRELALALNVSEMTVRRDLLLLEKKDLLKRVHGGAMLQLPLRDRYVTRDHDATDAKKSIAKMVVKQLADWVDTAHYPKVMYLDSGTTAMAVARELCLHDDLPALRIVMHGVNLAHYLSENSYHHLHLVGGEIYQNTYSTFGNDALNMVAQFNFDLFLLGASGFDHQRFTNTNYVEIAIKQAVIARSRTIWMMLDSSKWQKTDFATICDYAAIDRLFLAPLPHPQEQYILGHYPHLQLVQLSSSGEIYGTD